MLSTDADLLVGAWTTVQLDGSIKCVRAQATKVEQLARPDARNWGQCMCAARRETWDRFGLHNEALPAAEDLELWLRWMQRGAIVHHLDIPVHLYMLRLGSVISRQTDVRIVRRLVQDAYR